MLNQVFFIKLGFKLDDDENKKKENKFIQGKKETHHPTETFNMPSSSIYENIPNQNHYANKKPNYNYNNSYYPENYYDNDGFNYDYNSYDYYPGSGNQYYNNRNNYNWKK